MVSFETDVIRRNADLEQGFLEIASVLQRLGYSVGDTPLVSTEILQELTTRQRQVVLVLLKFHSVSTVAHKLGVSPHTVRNHLRAVYRKLEVRSMAGLFTKLRTSE